MVSKFIIRRTNDILSKYLPIKYEYVLFTGLSPMQKIYIIISLRLQKLKIDERYWVTTIKSYWDVEKLCNHPDLLDLPEDVEGSEEFIPDDYQSSIAGGSASRNREIQTWFSGKFLILERFLQKLIKKPMIKLF